MSKKSDAKYVTDIVQYAREAIFLAGEIDAERFQRDRALQLALERLVQIVGEAAYQMSATTRALFPDIPWPKIIGMRHRLVHGYAEIGYDIVWAVVSNDLPDLVAALEKFTPPEPP